MDIYSGSKRRIVASGIFTAPPDVGGGALMSHKGPYIKNPLGIAYLPYSIPSYLQTTLSRQNSDVA